MFCLYVILLQDSVFLLITLRMGNVGSIPASTHLYIFAYLAGIRLYVFIYLYVKFEWIEYSFSSHEAWVMLKAFWRPKPCVKRPPSNIQFVAQHEPDVLDMKEVSLNRRFVFCILSPASHFFFGILVPINFATFSYFVLMGNHFMFWYFNESNISQWTTPQWATPLDRTLRSANALWICVVPLCWRVS